MSVSDFTITLLGVGGSCAYSSARRSRYGANTSCALVEAGGQLVILDMGTGLMHLDKIDRADILLSHYHLDHIEGMPFFDSFYTGERFDIYGSPPPGSNVRAALSGLMQAPLLPITLEGFRADMCFHDVGEGHFITAGGVEVDAITLDHPGGCTGYKITYNGRSLVYLIDHERVGDKEINFCTDADLIVYDAHFTAEEFQSGRYKGWGHSHHEAGLALAEAAAAKRIVFVHHALWRTDDDLDALDQHFRTRFKDAFIGREEMRIEL